MIGICVGSFLNVVIYRIGYSLNNNNDQSILKGIFLGKSICLSCKREIKFFHNIPLVSYLYLKGKCYFCKSKFSIRYFFIELITGLLFMVVGFETGLNNIFQVLFLLALLSMLIILFFVDIDNFILPDEITIPLVWMGLAYNLIFPNSVLLENSVKGAILGYLFLYLFVKSYSLIRKKEMMGEGDFKLFAVIGAWMGCNYLLPSIIISSMISILLFMPFLFEKDKKLPFGPSLILSMLIIYFIKKYNLI